MKINTKNKAIREYYQGLEALANLDEAREGAVKMPFAELLEHCGQQQNWTLVLEYTTLVQGKRLRYDGALLNKYQLIQGVWEAKEQWQIPRGICTAFVPVSRRNSPCNFFSRNRRDDPPALAHRAYF